MYDVGAQGIIFGLKKSDEAVEEFEKEVL